VIEAKAKLPMRHLRIWSAGCSTGEEPYTLNMLLMEESAGLLKNWTFEILATDLNERSLAHCKHGAYGEYSTRNLTPYYRQKYFETFDNQLRIGPKLKTGITFSRLNLLDDRSDAIHESMNVIFCCNVLIYFDVLSKRHVIQHFYNNLLPHGYFLLGHSESLFGITDDFRLIHLPSTTAYVKSQQRQVVGR
jgi:chemotaxis protein methyltransferase CheR